MFKNLTAVTLLTTLLAGCGSEARLQVADGIGPHPQLPEPQPAMIPTMNVAPAEPWTDGQQPQAATGTTVTAFAEDLQHPRWIYVLPNGDVLVAESNAPKERPADTSGVTGWIQDRLMAKAGATVPSADRITLLRDADKDGRVEERTVFLEGLKSPIGMALVDGDFYVANTDAIVRFPYQPGETRITEPGETLVDLPAGPINHHWTKNIIASPDGRHLYATVGSNSNVAEHGMTAERGRAAIWLVDRTTGAHRVFAAGLRNPNGLAWVPTTGDLWTTVNERDGLGGDLVPDYMTSVDDGQFFGWPYSYYGQHVDGRVEPGNPELVEAAVRPDYALGPHTASLGLAYANGTALPDELQTGMFVGQHGSWNREPRSGYKVIFVPFEGGVPAGRPLDVLTDFVDGDGKARGRPVGVALDSSGALLVADDVGNTIWRVTSANTVAAGER